MSGQSWLSNQLLSSSAAWVGSSHIHQWPVQRASRAASYPDITQGRARPARTPQKSDGGRHRRLLTDERIVGFDFQGPVRHWAAGHGGQ